MGESNGKKAGEGAFHGNTAPESSDAGISSVVLFDKRGRKKILTQDDIMLFSLPGLRCAPYFAKRAALSMDAGIMLTSASMAAHRALRIPVRLEDWGSFTRKAFLGGFKPSCMEITCRGRKFRAAAGSNCDFLRIYLRFFDDIVAHDQYNLLEAEIAGKTVIDAGANAGVFSIFAAMLGASKVYAFEPVSNTFETLKENIRLNRLQGVVVPVNKALGQHVGKGAIGFSLQGDHNASMELKKAFSSSENVEITSLDAFLKKGKVGFIKIDTEGAEEGVLLGARKAIARWRPVLSFSAYHRPDDKVRLPQVVKRICPSYKVSLVNRGEPDFYCEIPRAKGAAGNSGGAKR